MVLSVYRYSGDIGQAVDLVNSITAYQGLGHTCGIHTSRDDHVDALAFGTRTARVRGPSPGMGCFTEDDSRATMRPHLRARIPGRTAVTRRSALVSLPVVLGVCSTMEKDQPPAEVGMRRRLIEGEA